MEYKSTIELTKELTLIPSPTGFTQNIITYIKNILTDNGIDSSINRKGSLLTTINGENNSEHRFITAHIDTLGAMVRSIKPDGRLKIDLIGGFKYNSIEGEYCTIHTQNSGNFSGTILMHQTSVHVYQDAGTAERNQSNIEIRLDERVSTPDDILKLGIQIGDFISFDPRTVITKNNFIKSRHLDDKVSAAILINFLIDLKKSGKKLPYTTHFLFSNNEEIGYGGNSNIDYRVIEYLAVDMGAMGDDQQTDEYSVSICVKDASGPYHLGLRNHLVNLCSQHKINYKLDIYPFYGSDASAAMKAGADIKHGLIGAGIDASHAFERTHIDSINATKNLVYTYLFSQMV
ncbi:M42 family metallopeptidase [Vagococcus vulneris]|uniref:Peptidase M42 n=1 Tax=Vagococcus vulneris TaxID=1977869 RepID=A0A429ZXU2_9ENTE|nr:M42 family metallopeptidase [Vagococcus vulneris]RST98716.1 peptidase M42 [Vagococcus vulneris]